MTLVAALLAAPVLALIHAIVVRTLWSWFAVPLGVPNIGYAHAYGLALLIPDARTQQAIADALAEAATELAMSNECGDVRTTVSSDFYPYQTEA